MPKKPSIRKDRSFFSAIIKHFAKMNKENRHRLKNGNLKLTDFSFWNARVCKWLNKKDNSIHFQTKPSSMPKKDEVLEKCFSKARVIWLSKSTVAPFTGAWIETLIRKTEEHFIGVAPFTGAWIETSYACFPVSAHGVAPFTGAWIETNRRWTCIWQKWSHPTRVRGMKQLSTSCHAEICKSHPSRVRGLKR